MALTFTTKKTRTPYKGTVLSKDALGEAIDSLPTLPPSYVKNGVKIIRKKYLSQVPAKLYPTILINPPLGWYPSKWANFKLSKKLDDLFFFSLIPEKINASLWISVSNHKTIRVGRDQKLYIQSLLSRNGLWYSRTRNLWKPRWDFEKTQRALQEREVIKGYAVQK